MCVTHLRKFSDFIRSTLLVAMKRNQIETSFVVIWSFCLNQKPTIMQYNRSAHTV